MSFHVQWLLRKFIVDDSRSSSISFKYNVSLRCKALKVRGEFLYLILGFIGKMCQSMQRGVVLSLTDFGEPTLFLLRY